MNRIEKETKYYLGLDIGIGSVGWGIIGEENGEHRLEDFGVRLFNAPEESKNKKSLAEKRREFRGKRRLLNRWNCQREDLIKLFSKIFQKDFKKDLHNFLELRKSTNLLDYDPNKYFNPYVIRYRALSNKIELVELLYILLHISKYRGYKIFYQGDNLDEIKQLNQKIKDLKNSQQINDSGTVKKELAEKTKRLNELEKKEENKAVTDTEKLFQENNYCSVAEMVIKNEKFRHSQHQNLVSAHNHNPNKEYENKEEVKKNHKHFIFPREKLEEEVRKILIEQIKHYPQLPKIFEKSLEINRIRETRNDIEKIIFRQRDFEDGPTEIKPRSQEKSEIGNWKKHNRNISFTPFTETTGYCQYFPTERRDWQCSFIYCCYQFVNEFSKIGSLEEKELGGLEKVKEIHQQVFEWLISSSGYQPKTLSQAEKEEGKRRETFRKQLEELLNKLVGKGNYSFPKGVEFKTGFLDYLKENSSFYSVLWKKCPSQFYLSYKDYQKTIFYQLGQIILKMFLLGEEKAN